MTDHDCRRLIAAAEKTESARRNIVREFCRRFPNDPWVLSLAADELALAELKESLAKKSRVDEFAPAGAG